MNSGRQGAAAAAPHAAESPPQCPFRDVDDTPFDWAVIYSVLLCYSPVAAADGGGGRRRTAADGGGALVLKMPPLLLYRE